MKSILKWYGMLAALSLHAVPNAVPNADPSTWRPADALDADGDGGGDAGVSLQALMRILSPGHPGADDPERIAAESATFAAFPGSDSLSASDEDDTKTIIATALDSVLDAVSEYLITHNAPASEKHKDDAWTAVMHAFPAIFAEVWKLHGVGGQAESVFKFDALMQSHGVSLGNKIMRDFGVDVPSVA